MPDSDDRDRVPAHTASALCSAYGFDEVVVGERLHGGYANDLFRVTADGRSWVLRFKHPPLVEHDIAWEHQVTRALSEILPEVAAPIETRRGGTIVRVADRVGWLMPFISAVPADATREGDRIAAARALGRLHHAAQGLCLSPRPRLRPLSELAWPPLAIAPELEAWTETIAAARAWAVGYVADLSRTRRAPTSLIHGDFFPGNVLVAGGRAIGIIDWEEAQVDWLSWDLASAIGSFCAAGDDLDRGACRRFVDAYRAAGGPARPGDDDLLIPLIAVKRILEVLRAPTDRHPRWDYQQANLRALTRLPGVPI